MHAVWNWLLSVTGSNNLSGKWYGFWSGFGGDLFIFGGIVGFYHKHNCHAARCPRIGKHVYSGTLYCTKHRRVT